MKTTTQEFFIDDTVRTFDDKIGTISSQPFIFPDNGIEGVLVNLVGIGSIAYNVTGLEIVTVESMWAELQAVPSYCERDLSKEWA